MSTIINGKLSDPLCDSVKKDLTIVRLIVWLRQIEYDLSGLASYKFLMVLFTLWSEKINNMHTLSLYFYTKFSFTLFTTNFVCSFVCLCFIVELRIFRSYGDVTITSEGLQIPTYARHSGRLSSKGSLISVPNLSVTRASFHKVISEDPWHSHLLPSV